MAVEVLARPPLEVGEGRFLIVDELGEGGTAIVYLAYDRYEQSWCALKALLFQHLANDDIRRRFNQEAVTLGAFDHPNIPRLVAHAPDARRGVRGRISRADGREATRDGRSVTDDGHCDERRQRNARGMRCGRSYRRPSPMGERTL